MPHARMPTTARTDRASLSPQASSELVVPGAHLTAMHGVHRRSTAPETSAAVPPIVEEALRGPGAELDAATRARMEARLGHDFSRVRIHDDARAEASAQAIHALAYTVENHLVFGRGRYAPGTERGERLLAHELVHTRSEERRV